MNEIRVSVIIPVYNAERYLSDTLDCVINQTLKEIEIICVDDGSVDRSVEILNHYKVKDDRIKVLYQTEPSAGAALARNMGLKAAKGEYLSFLDADDLFEADMLEKAYYKAKESDADIVAYDAFLYATDKNIDKYSNLVINYGLLQGKEIFNPKDYADSLFNICLGAVWNHMFKRSLIIDNTITFKPIPITDDATFVFLAYAMAEKIAVLKDRLVHYRGDAQGNQTKNYHKHPETAYMPFICLKEELEKRNVFDIYKKGFVRIVIDSVIGYLNFMQDMDSYKKLYLSLRDKYLQELCVYDVYIGREDLVDSIRTLEPEDFLVKKNNFNLYNEECFCLPYEWNKNDRQRVVLYGAGQCGRRIFGRLMDEHNIDVVCWVDKSFMKYNGFVKSPEVISTVEFDCIFVAVLDRNTYKAIKKYILGMGIPEEKIIWVGEQY